MRQSRRNAFAFLMAAAAAIAVVPVKAHDGDSHGGAPAAGAPKRSPNALGTSAAVDAQGRLWVAYVESTGQSGPGPAPSNISLRWTADDGKTWSPVRQVLRAPEPVEANGEGRPKLAFGPAGQMYITYTRPLARPHTGDIRFVRSTDGGFTFSEPVIVQRDRGLTAHRFDSVIVDREGRIFIAWIDKRDGDAARAEKRPYRGAAVYYAVSTDDGASFGPDIRIADNSCECCRIALSLDQQGNVVSMWRHVFEPNVRDHAMSVLPPAGSPVALTRVSFDDWRIDACPHHGPSLAYDGDGRRHQVWFSAANDEGGVFYAAADSSGVLGKPTRIGGAQAEHGEIVAAGSTVAIAWKEFDGRSTSVKARVSEDGGKTWKEQTLASTQGSSDHPHLVLHGGAVRLVWNTDKEGIVVRRVEVKS